MQTTASLINNSLSFCSKKCNYTRDQVLKSLQENCPTIHSRVRYALAKELARYLGENHGDVLAVYVYGSTMKDTAGKMSDIDLIVLVNENTPALAESIQRLNEGLMSLYRVILGDASLPLRRLLDVHVVDFADMTARRGYGALLGSLYDPPTRIWRCADKKGTH